MSRAAGLRWSDRPQDFRTEVLGLVKAQQVKNAVIVPVGAKGGFFPKSPAACFGSAGRGLRAEGRRSLPRAFVGITAGSVTDNLVGDKDRPAADDSAAT